MITRGHFIGQIIDDLTDISNQVENRCRLNLTDINIFLEDFYKEVLNSTLSLGLLNLNSERQNSPGLDLGDKSKKIAFQITSDKSSDKVNETLEKSKHLVPNVYEKIIVFIISKKQKSYTLDKNLCNQLKFDESCIWDVNSLLKEIMVLPIDKLEDVYQIIKKQAIKVRIELEIPDKDGQYSTSFDQFVESIPKAKFGAFNNYIAYQKGIEASYSRTANQILADYQKFSKKLEKLPRISREFFKYLLEQKETEGYEYGNIQINHSKIKRACRYSDLDEEIRILENDGLVRSFEQDEDTGLVWIWVDFRAADEEYFLDCLIDYAQSKGIGLQNPIVNLDFSGF